MITDMEKNKKDKSPQIFRKLQQHLNKQPVGFPRDRSGSDIRILMKHFTPEEAAIALRMSYRYEPAETIHRRLDDTTEMEQLEIMLDRMSSKMSILQRERDGVLYYCLIPLAVGMYEGRVFEMDADYVKAYDEYAHSMQHGISFISTEVMQMRTIPIEKSIETKNHVMRYDDVTALIENTGGPILIIECTCRKTQSIKGEQCSKTSRIETCMVFGDIAKMMQKYGNGREIGKTEALEIARENQREGLVLQAYNMQNPEVICSCCSCCCGILGIHSILVNPVNFWSSSYHALMDTEKCRGCRLCIKTCQVDAVRFDEKRKKASIKKNRCIGCGNCVPVCKFGALSLEKNIDAEIPPADYDDLQETIMKKKPVWRLGRIIGRALGWR